MQCQQQQSPLLAPCTYTIKYIIRYYTQTAYINPKGPKPTGYNEALTH